MSGTITFEGPVEGTAEAVDGVFEIDLPPGEYTVSARPTGNLAAAPCPIRRETVEVAQTAPLAVYCFVE